MVFPIMMKDLVKYRNKNETFRRRKVGPWLRTIDRESSLRGSNSARSVSELAGYLIIFISILPFLSWESRLICLALNFIHQRCILSFYIFLCIEYITHWGRTFCVDDIFFLIMHFLRQCYINFHILTLHFLYWWHFLPRCHIFYLYDIFYLVLLFFFDVAFSIAMLHFLPL